MADNARYVSRRAIVSTCALAGECHEYLYIYVVAYAGCMDSGDGVAVGAVTASDGVLTCTRSITPVATLMTM